MIKLDSINFCKNREKGVYLHQNQSNRNNLCLGSWSKTQRKVCETKKKRGRGNLPQKVFETKYFLITARALMVLTKWFEKVDHCANNFSYLQDLKKKIEEIKEYFKMRCMKLHIARLDGYSHDITLLTYRPELRVPGKPSPKILVQQFKSFSF